MEFNVTWALSVFYFCAVFPLASCESKSVLIREPWDPGLKTDANSSDWQQEAVQIAESYTDTTAGLQYLLRVASRVQESRGHEPAVVVTIANHEGVTELLPIFRNSLSKIAEDLATTTIVIAVSKTAFEACKDLTVLCFFDKEAAQRNHELHKEAVHSKLPRNKTPQFLQIGWDKLKRLQDALEVGVDILFADTDIVWLRDPVPLLRKGEAATIDLQLTHDGWGVNIGVMLVRPTPCSREFMRHWLARRNSPEARDQYEFQAAVDSAKISCPSFQVKHLEKDVFPNGCCCGGEFPRQQEAAEKWALWHAACGGDLPSKKHHLARIAQAAAHLKASRRPEEGPL